MAFVRFVIAASIFLGSRRWSVPVSTKTGSAPACRAQNEDAMNE